MTRSEFVSMILMKAPLDQRPVFIKPIQVLADLIYDPELADFEVEQILIAARTFEIAGTQFAGIAERLSRLASERGPV